MKKWKCLNEECAGKCEIYTKQVPLNCVLDDECADWEKVTEEPVTDCNHLPDWCKVGAWGYDTAEERYFEIVGITQFNVDVAYIGKDWRYNIGRNVFDDNYKQARLRPYNAEEMKALVGKVLKHDTGLYLVTAFENRWNQVKIESAWREEEELLEKWTIDDMPCGVFEHLEDGEWAR